MGVGHSPKQRRCATGLAHRPALGESCQFGHRIAAHLAQRPGLGEIGLFGAGQTSAKPLVGVLAFRASPPKPGRCASVFLPSRDVVSETQELRAGNRPSLPSKDNVHVFLAHCLGLGEMAPDDGIRAFFCSKVELVEDEILDSVQERLEGEGA